MALHKFTYVLHLMKVSDIKSPLNHHYMALQSLGELREKIDSNKLLTRFGQVIEKQTGQSFASILNRFFPRDGQEVIGNVRLQTFAVLCGNQVAGLNRDNGVLLILSGQISSELLRIMGFDSMASEIDDWD